jgi:hypothetical protein
LDVAGTSSNVTGTAAGTDDVTDTSSIGIGIGIEESRPAATLLQHSSVDLTALFPADAQLVGVALGLDSTDPDAHPYVLEARSGLYEILAGEAKLVFDLHASNVLAGTGDGSPPSELTDVTFDPLRSAENGAPSFLLTGENDGYSLTLPGPSLTSYFCYLPRPSNTWSASTPPSVSQRYQQQGIAVSERTEAVAISELSEQIFAQPRTTRMDSFEVVGSELFAFDTSGGQPTAARSLTQPDFAAGGAAFLQVNALWLGYGASLYVTNGWAENIRRIATLEGVDTITGMASDGAGKLLVLDGPHRRLLELDSNELTALDNASSAP